MRIAFVLLLGLLAAVPARAQFENYGPHPTDGKKKLTEEQKRKVLADKNASAKEKKKKPKLPPEVQAAHDAAMADFMDPMHDMYNPQVGVHGYVPAFKVVHVIDKNNMLARMNCRETEGHGGIDSGKIVWVKYPTDGVEDEKLVRPDGKFIITGTKTFGLSTFLFFEPYTEELEKKDREAARAQAEFERFAQKIRQEQQKEEEEQRTKRSQETLEKRREAIEKAKWRSWTTADGEHTTFAKYVKMSEGQVQLEKKDGTVITVPSDTLSKDDLRWIWSRGWEQGKSWVEGGKWKP